MRYLLDTNILAFLVIGDKDSISADVSEIISDYSNQICTSSIAVFELIQLYKAGKVKPKAFKSAIEIQNAIENQLYIKVLPFGNQQTATLAELVPVENHKDPFDHAIISHAISEKLTLVSSDRQFEKYTSQKLNFVFNKR
ncbi:MAG: type II toxin-antitoxin system VapC family toxin [Bergeyella sp.]